MVVPTSNHTHAMAEKMQSLSEVVAAAASRRRPIPDPEVRRAIRSAAGLTQRELALVLGVDRATVSRYELGTRSPIGTRRERYLSVLEELRRG